MKCMYAQTRPRFILSSDGVFGGMEFEPMLTPREKSPLPKNVPRGGSNPRHCGQRAQALPTELFRPPFLFLCALLLMMCMANRWINVTILCENMTLRKKQGGESVYQILAIVCEDIVLKNTDSVYQTELFLC